MFRTASRVCTTLFKLLSRKNSSSQLKPPREWPFLPKDELSSLAASAPLKLPSEPVGMNLIGGLVCMAAEGEKLSGWNANELAVLALLSALNVGLLKVGYGATAAYEGAAAVIFID